MLRTRPWPVKRPRPAIVPVFIPFMGCPARCVFCRQDAQTGIVAGSGDVLAGGLARARAELRRRAQKGLAPAELAFYGGTFTAIPGHALDICLDFARNARAEGLISSFRCSTRPDCLDAAIIDRLMESGLGAMELGAQSFDDKALGLCRRGYTAGDIGRACGLLRSAGLPFCIQLLPGLPGHSPGIFLEDVRAAIGLGAAMLRFYPCIVLEGTGLAAMWRQGRYLPWSLDVSVGALARGWLMAASSGVDVIRMGLAPEPGLVDASLAGPMAADLGSRVQGLALVLAAEAMVTGAGRRPCRITLPWRCSGFYLGHGRELAPRWRQMGIEPSGMGFGRQDCLEILFAG